MDDAERRLRESMASAVEGWEPALGQVRRVSAAHDRRARVVLVAVIGLLVASGGVGTAISLAGGAHRRPATLAADAALSAPSAPAASAPGCPGLQFLSESAYVRMIPAALPTGCPSTPISDCPSATETGPSPSGDAYHPLSGDGGAYESTLCFAPATAPAATISPPIGISSPTSSPSSPSSSPTTARASASPSVSASPKVRACNTADFAVQLSTDQSTYAAQAAVSISLTARVLHTCDSPDYGLEGSVQSGSANGQSVEAFGAGCLKHNGITPKCPFVPSVSPSDAMRQWKVGETYAASDTWNQVSGFDQGSPVYADAGKYVVSADLDNVIRGTATFTISAPMCPDSQVGYTLTTDKSTYAPGETVTMTVTQTNTGTTSCEMVPGDSREETPAIDGSGVTVWSGCGSAGQSAGADCAIAAAALAPRLYEPGMSTTFSKTWDLTADGTPAHPAPAPVAAGDYTLSLHPSNGGAVSTMITVAG